MILVRHAESEWNRHFSRTRIDPGIPDAPLTDIGLTQAAGLIEQLAAAGIARLIASPYQRTLQTASIVADALGLPITVEPLVRERCVFSCDLGSHPDDLATRWPALDFDHLEPQWWGVPAESEASLGRRCTTFRRQTDGLVDRSQVAVVTHWGVIRTMTGQDVGNAAVIPLT